MRLQSGRRNIVPDLVLCLTLFVVAVVLYSSLFLHVPVLTEVRDFLIQQGWGARLSDLWIPTGNDYRPLSWSFFAWQHRLFPFDAEAINLIQFVLLGLGALTIYIHTLQLLGKRSAAFGASILWIFSLPAIHAAFWQATQHDKLAFIFILLTLIVSLYAIRMDRPKLTPVFTALLLVLVAVAVATKPVAFMLPGALVAQVILFTPKKNRSGYLRAGAVILVPAVYASIYAAGYLLKMNEDWRAHATSGDITTNILIYVRSVTNLDYDGSLRLAVLLFVPVGFAWVFALWRWGKSHIMTESAAKTTDDRDAVLVYLCAIFMGCIIVLARARHPVSFYVLLPMFAFTASLATVATSFLANESVRIRRYGISVILAVVIGLLLSCWGSVTGKSRLGNWSQAATNLAEGYAVLRDSVDTENIQFVSFFFSDEPPGYFYFFSDGAHSDIDPAIPSFIFHKTMNTPIKNIFGEFPPLTAAAGELVAVWSQDLQLIETKAVEISHYHNSGASTWFPTYVPGSILGFGKGDKGKRYLSSGWSWQEDHGTWSDGDVATLVLKLDRLYQIPLELVISGQSFVPEQHPRQDIEVLANDHLIAHWTFRIDDGPVELRALIPTEIVSLANLKLSFRILNPRSPASLGLAPDDRQLGIFLQELQIRPLHPKGGGE